MYEPWQDFINRSILADVNEAEIGNARVFVVKSESDPLDWYYVLVFADDETGAYTYACGKCDGFRFRDTCRHTKKVQEIVAKEVDKPTLRVL